MGKFITGIVSGIVGGSIAEPVLRQIAGVFHLSAACAPFGGK